MVDPNGRAPLLSLTGLTKRFGPVSAVWNVHLDIYPGDFFALFGPNGAGKTTLLRMVAGLTTPSSGQMRMAGEIRRNPHQIGYVSHQTLLYNEMTGLENLVFYGRLYGLNPARAGELLQRLGLEPAAHRLVREYSRGMKQRLTLARALLHEPQLLLLDEPYTGLDQHGSRLLTSILRELRQERRTVFLITHNLGEGLELCTRLGIQHRGEIVFEALRGEMDRDGLERHYFEIVDK